MKIENEEMVINLGAIGYDAKLVAKLLDLPEKDVTKALSDEKSELFKLYDKGRIMAEYVIDIKLFELAKSGDLKALDKLTHRKALRENGQTS